MTIEIQRHGRVAVVTINRPDAMNSLDPEHNDQLTAFWQDFRSNPDVDVAVLTGAGSAFSAGADLKRMIPEFRRMVERGERPAWNFGAITHDLTNEKPILAAVNGHALAGGLELALACDIRLCSPNATFGLAETRWALMPAAGGTQRLPWTVPFGLAMEMILSGDPIDAETALRAGLVNRIVPAERLLETTVELAERISERGPLAVRAAKRATLAALTLPLEDGLELEQRLFTKLLGTRDGMEGPTAFAERRAPVYTGE